MSSQKKSKFNIKEFIEQWNKKHPYDRWWRKKYNIPFGSEKHLQQNHIDMVIEYREDLYFKQLGESSVAEEYKQEEASLISNIVAYKQNKLLSQQNKTISDKEYDDIDLSQFNDVK